MLVFAELRLDVLVFEEQRRHVLVSCGVNARFASFRAAKTRCARLREAKVVFATLRRVSPNVLLFAE